MELPAAESADGEPGPCRDAIVGKPARIRRAQQDGLLDAAWDPIDIMVLVFQIALTWSDQAELAALVPAPPPTPPRPPVGTLAGAAGLNAQFSPGHVGVAGAIRAS
ncbi:hypothetical protein [Saccharopolyspora elongata]|uniref:HTH-type transcriptional repressor Sco4008 C-terminal domain-containing protein n=1 Tax=Saccharopolyspora elongata TaxID=2530387 RepID=A0A4R4ZD25_9PSEU|nr:hypothetical protein [Saccharopolyspora elongata]TDD55169.1 hypothetical protein E1288_04980 [Saccharopolyspora elongata]